MRWPSSRNRPRIAVPLALVVTEATWASLLANGVFDTARGPRVQIGLLTLLVPATIAVVLGATLLRPRGPSRRRRWWRRSLFAVALIVGTALSAGVIADLAHGGSFWRVATQPWTVSGHRRATVAGVAWFVAVLAWTRGTWLGVVPPSFAHAARSVALGALAFVGVFAGRADTHAVAFRGATGSAGGLLFLAFPCAVATLALIRQGELQEEVAPGSRREAGPLWFGVLSVPMLAAAVVALLVAVAVGPVVPVVGRGVARAAKAVWWVVTKVAAALWRLFPKARALPLRHPARSGHSPLATLPRPAAHSHPESVPLALEIVLALIALALLVLVLRALRPLRRLRGQQPTSAAEAETDSVFSWRHLAAQVWQALLGIFRRRHPPPPTTAPVLSEATGPERLATVRLAYRDVLAAARSGGWPRFPSETTRDVERRLAAGPAAAEAMALGELTDLYDAARYGERRQNEREEAVALARAEAVRAALIDATTPPASAEP